MNRRAIEREGGVTSDNAGLHLAVTARLSAVLFALLSAFPAVASDTDTIHFAGFEFGSTNRTYSMRVLDIPTAFEGTSGYLDALGTTNLLCSLEYGPKIGLKSVSLTTNGPRWPGSMEKYAEVIHRAISELERHNGGTLFGWPGWGFINVDPPACPSPEGFPLHTLWDLMRGEFGEHCLRRVDLYAVSRSGLMIWIDVESCGRWSVSVRMEDEYHKRDRFRGDLTKKLRRWDTKVERWDEVFGDNPPPSHISKPALKNKSDDRFQERGNYFMEKLGVRLNWKDRTLYRWRAPEEFSVRGKTYQLGRDSLQRVVVLEKETGRRLQVYVDVEESSCEADSIICAFQQFGESSMPTDDILKRLSYERSGDLVLLDGMGSCAVLKNIIVHVRMDSDGLAFAKAILNAGWKQRVKRFD